jgi:hypothetical protein
MTMIACPNCTSDKTRRGGWTIWTIYLILIVLALAGVFVFKLNAAIIAGVMLAAIAVAHLFLEQRVCLDCGHQWRGK